MGGDAAIGAPCPGCGAAITPGTNLCPNCQYPILLVRPETVADSERRAPTRRPGDAARDPLTTRIRSGEPIRRNRGDGERRAYESFLCPACGHSNQGGRTLCEVCAAPLRAIPSASTPVATPPERPPPRSPWLNRRAVVAGVATVLFLSVAVTATITRVWTVVGPWRIPAATSATTGPRPAGPLQTVAAAVVTAAASSTRASKAALTYAAANMLDGRLDTAWNSDGDRDGTGEGMTLTFGFTSPQDIRRITVWNGYQRDVGQDGSPVDLYHQNGRPASVQIVTDQGTWQTNLADAPAAQFVDAPFGPTAKVTITVLTVYRGTKYRDLAVSEVLFATP